MHRNRGTHLYVRSLLTLLALILTTAGCGRSTPPAPEREGQARPSASTPGPIAAVDDGGGDWVRPAKDYASTRFSALDEITRDSVKRLAVAATSSTGVTRGHEAAPLVVQGTMYIVTPFPNVLYALDLTRPGAPLKWKYEPKPVAASQGVACCDVVNRG